MNLNLRFPAQQQDFFSTLSQRVNAYFKTNKIERTANAEMVVKTIFMFSLFFTPYFIALSGVVTSLWGLAGLCVIMGLGVAGIGLSIMHDANHGSYSNKKWVNDFLGYSLNLVGGHYWNWRVQHNVLHHTYTNVHDTDEDISPRGVLRMAPGSEWKPMHRFQHIYAWFFYGLLTLVWVSFKDFQRLIKYQKEGLVTKQKTKAINQWVGMLVSKTIYVGYMLIVPMLVLKLSFGQVFVGFLIIHYVAGFILAIIFQPAHVIEGTEYPVGDENNMLENNWAIHQMHTTTNFGHREKLFSWYVGGLNYQVEHHLFPNICHVHYRAIAPIVEQTAKEFGIPYKTKATFWEALVAHTRQLKMLGQKPVSTPPVAAMAA
ncbi:MAG: fatty acid desaturase family protein [Cyclobacteriaceae bacterium]|jgi:linoleoyl-CoA desaturase